MLLLKRPAAQAAYGLQILVRVLRHIVGSVQRELCTFRRRVRSYKSLLILQDYQISFTGRFNIYDLLLDQAYFDSSLCAVSKEHMTLIKVRVLREWWICPSGGTVCGGDRVGISIHLTLPMFYEVNKTL